MAETLLFSIVIPCYNYGHWLARAVDSVLAQDGADWELLVINDGSTDNTDGVATELLRQHGPRLGYLTQPNRGVAATRNRGIDATAGRYLIFLDADDEMAPGALGVYRELIARNPDADLLAGAYRAITEDGRERIRRTGTLASSRRQRLRAYLFTKQLNFSNSAVAFRRQVFAQRRYPETLRSAEDIPVFAHIVATREIAVTSVLVAIAHRHRDSLRHTTDNATVASQILLDELFRPGAMPSWALACRRRYETQHYLSRFRTCYLAGENARALDFYQRAWRTGALRTLSRWSYLRKYLALRLGRRSH